MKMKSTRLQYHSDLARRVLVSRWPENNNNNTNTNKNDNNTLKEFRVMGHVSKDWSAFIFLFFCFLFFVSSPFGEYRKCPPVTRTVQNFYFSKKATFTLHLYCPTYNQLILFNQIICLNYAKCQINLFYFKNNI